PLLLYLPPPPPTSTLFPYTTLFRSTVPTTASVFLNIPVPNTAKSQLESSARHSTVSMKMWYCPLFPKCSKLLPSMTSMTELSLRSEEHTSELQSRFDLVCRLLLEKK